MADKDGKVQAIRSVRRLAVEERWGKDNRRWVKGVPWNRYKGDEYQDGEIPEGVDVEEQVDENGALGAGETRNPVRVEVKTTRVRPRDFHIRKEDAERLGFSRGCGGCSSWFKGRSRQPHTEEFRERFRKLLADEARVKYAAEKRREFDDKMEEKARKKLARTGGNEREGGYV